MHYKPYLEDAVLKNNACPIGIVMDIQETLTVWILKMNYLGNTRDINLMDTQEAYRCTLQMINKDLKYSLFHEYLKSYQSWKELFVVVGCIP